MKKKKKDSNISLKTLSLFCPFDKEQIKIFRFLTNESKKVFNHYMFYLNIYNLYKHQIYDDIFTMHLENKIYNDNINDYVQQQLNEYSKKYIENYSQFKINNNIIYKIIKNPKPYKSGNILVHGLISCKNCSNVWNRDVNGATNIYRIAKNAVNGLERPEYLLRSGREKKEENVKVEKPKKEKVKKVVQKKAKKSVKVVALTKS